MADDKGEYPAKPQENPAPMSFKDWQKYNDECQWRGSGFQQLPFEGKVE